MPSRPGAPERRPASTGDHGAEVGRSSLVNLSGALVSALSTLLLVLLTARVLSPGDAGRVFALTSWLLVTAGVLRFGTPTAVVLFTARLEAATPTAVRRIAGLAIRPVGRATLLATVVLAVLLLTGQDGGGLVGSVAIGLVLLLALPAVTLLDTVLAVSRGTGRMGPTVAIDRLGRPAAQLLLTAVALWHPSVLTVVAAWCLPYVAALALARAATPELARGTSEAPVPDPAERRAFVRFVVPRGAASITQVLFARLDILLVAALASPAQAAVYTVATRFVTVCQVVQQALSTAGEPLLARTLGRHGVAASVVYRTTTLWLVLLLWPLLLTVVALAPEWLALFGPAYGEAWPVVTVLAVAMLVAMAVGMVETVLNMDGRAGLPLLTGVLALVCMLLVDLVTIPQHGALGAAWGWALAITVKNLLSLAVLVRSTGHHPVHRAWLLAIAVNAASVGLLPWVGRALAGDDGRVAGTAAGLALLLGAYVALRRPLRLDLLLGSARRPRRPTPVTAPA